MRCARACLALLLAGARIASAQLTPGQVVVVANERLSNSVALARHYIALRQIPATNLVLLDLPENETLSRGFYETRLRDPLLAALRERGLIEQARRPRPGVGRHETEWLTVRSSVRAVVCLRGVPLRVAPSQSRLLAKAARVLQAPLFTDGAALDSELALLLADPYAIDGRVSNPAYQLLRWPESGELLPKLLIATRLDAADDATVRRMMEDAVATERTGLEGRAYVDQRQARVDGYELGDVWMEESIERMERDGFECVVDRHDGIFGPAYPMETPAVYLGWYAETVLGPFLRPGFRFARGAVAYHLHSASAQSLRDPARYWVAPLLAAGACVTMGATDEPLLGLTPNLAVFTDRLCRGLTFGESATMALPALSWHITLVGDPLYRPWAHPLNELLRRLDAGEPDGDWIVIRQINRLVREGRYNAALDGLRRRLREHESPVLQEKLGDLYAVGDLTREAARVYGDALKAAPTAEAAVRLCGKAQAALRGTGQKEEAFALDAQVRQRWAGHECLRALDPPRM